MYIVQCKWRLVHCITVIELIPIRPPSSVLVVDLRIYLVVPGFNLSRVPRFIRICIIVPVYTWIYVILPVYTWIYVIVPGFTWLYVIVPEFTWFDVYIYINTRTSIHPA